MEVRRVLLPSSRGAQAPARPQRRRGAETSWAGRSEQERAGQVVPRARGANLDDVAGEALAALRELGELALGGDAAPRSGQPVAEGVGDDRKSTRLNSSH